MSSINTANNKRIAKNTIFLYIRMLLTMVINIYTARIVLQVLGEVDYGIYNVVAGIVVMLSFLNSTLTNGTQRFFNYAIGENNIDELKKTLSNSILIQIVIALCILIICETIGIYIVNNTINIPENRLHIANFIFQFSILAIIISLLQIPFTALVIAYEKMSVFAYIGIVEVILKLILVFILSFTNGDKLFYYALLMTFSQGIICFLYFIYCKIKYCHLQFTPSFDKEEFRNMLSFSGWNTIGSIASVLLNQGVSLILNVFFGPSINASRALAIQVNNALNNFVNGYQTAANPQIVKLYASGNKTEMFNLIITNSILSFCLMYIVCAPILFNIDFILSIWLKSVPQYTNIFCIIMIMQSLISSYQRPLGMAIYSCGKMKLPNLTSSIIYLAVIPISIVILHIVKSPEIPLIISCIVFPLTMITDLIILKNYINFPIKKFIKNALLKIVTIFLITYIPLYIFNHYYFSKQTFGIFIVSTIISELYIIMTIFYIGLSSTMKQKIYNKVQHLSRKVNKHD